MYVALMAATILLSGNKKKSNDYTNSRSTQPIGYNQQPAQVKQAVEYKATEANEDLLHEAVLFKHF